MIEIENVEYKYRNGKVALKDINLEIKEGEFISIIGKNGSGKSTLGKLIAGLIYPTKGEVIVKGIGTKEKSKFLDLRKTIGIVFQNPENQIVFDRVYDDIAFGLKNIKAENIDEKIKTVLEKVNMGEHINSNPYELSMGQKQRIAIASILAMEPKIIIFDEPTTMLDPEGKQDVRNIIKDLNTNGYTIIIITNDLNEIALTSRNISLKNGEVCNEKCD